MLFKYVLKLSLVNYKTHFLLLWAILLCSLFACDKSTPNGPEDNGYDKTAMLTSYADNLIIPAYQEMQQKMNALQTISEAYLAVPNTTTLSALKTAYFEAHLQYENIAAFQFGPAETQLLDIFVNFSGGLDYDFTSAGELTGFSIDTISIENNISTGVYNLSSVSRNSFYSQGFPALNYLIFEPQALDRLAANPVGRAKYIRDVVSRLKTLIDQVAGDWKGFRASFISNTQSNVGSPIGNLVNQLAYQLDLMKGPRIGWPFGKQSGGLVFANKCEAYYAGISGALALENLRNLKVVYTGGDSGKGLSDYLIALNQATLNEALIAQFDKAIAAVQVIPDPMSTAFSTDPEKIEAAYKELQKLLTLLKTDVASVTGVQITFTDNDGD